MDGSERIAGFARQIAAKNALDASAGGPVSIVTGKVEELAALLGGVQADVLVSEWMGYALLFESMLDSVLHARDRCGWCSVPHLCIVTLLHAHSLKCLQLHGSCCMA